MKTVSFAFLFFCAVGSFAQSADQYYDMGKDAYDKKEYQTSVEYFTRSIALSPKGYAYWYRGSAYWGLLNYIKAAEDYSRALLFADNNDDKATLYLNRADCYFMLDDYRGAANDYREYLKLQPGKAEAYNQLGRSLMGLKEYASANEAFKNAMLLANSDEDRAVYKYNIGLTETEFLNYAGAEISFSEAIKYNDKYEKAYYRRAEVNTVRKKYNAAIDDYDKALTIVTSDYLRSYICLHKGLVYDLANMNDKAFESFKKATSLNASDEDAWYDLGRLTRIKMKNELLARTFFQKAIDLATASSTDTSSTYVYCKTLMGQSADAIAYQLRKIQSSKGNEYRYKWELHNMSCIQALAGNTTRAQEYVERSMAAGFDDYDHLLNDRDLKSLFNTIQWKNMLVKYKIPKPKYE
jgi:tetratricopeptide (TPR) repeat protein